MGIKYLSSYAYANLGDAWTEIHGSGKYIFSVRRKLAPRNFFFVFSAMPQHRANYFFVRLASLIPNWSKARANRTAAGIPIRRSRDTIGQRRI